jgi:hypothetical protein
MNKSDHQMLLGMKQDLEARLDTLEREWKRDMVGDAAGLDDKPNTFLIFTIGSWLQQKDGGELLTIGFN